MLSIKKHIDNLDGAEAMLAARQEVFDCLLEVTRERMPCRDDAERKRFADEIEGWARELRRRGQPQAVRDWAEDGAAILHQQWDRFADYLRERETTLTEIISLLARTAGRLDESNRDFYQLLNRSVKSLEEVGQIQSISILRSKLAERLERLDLAVNLRQSESTEQITGLKSNLEKARSEVQAFSRLVNTRPLRALPSRRHAEQLLEELAESKRPFSLAALTLSGMDSFARRYGDDCVETLRAGLIDRLRKLTPADTHLYQWDSEVVVLLTETGDSSDMEKLMESLASGLRRTPLESKQSRSAPIAPQARWVIYERRDQDPPQRAAEIIRRFQEAMPNPSA